MKAPIKNGGIDWGQVDHEQRSADLRRELKRPASERFKRKATSHHGRCFDHGDSLVRRSLGDGNLETRNIIHE